MTTSHSVPTAALPIRLHLQLRLCRERSQSLLESVRRLQKPRLIEPLGHELNPDRKALRIQPARHAERRDTCEACGDGAEILRVQLTRIIQLLVQSKRDRRGSGCR